MTDDSSTERPEQAGEMKGGDEGHQGQRPDREVQQASTDDDLSLRTGRDGNGPRANDAQNNRDHEQERSSRVVPPLLRQWIPQAASASVALCAFALALYQANVSNEQMRLSTQAWIGVSKIVLMVGGPLPQIEVTYSNSGKTPATNVKVILIAKPVFGVPDFKYIDRPSGQGGIGAGDDNRVFAWVELPTPGDRRSLYVHGEIEYRDIFGRKHQTAFCARFDPHTKSWLS
jgi:hypothetical protein